MKLKFPMFDEEPTTLAVFVLICGIIPIIILAILLVLIASIHTKGLALLAMIIPALYVGFRKGMIKIER